MKLLGILASPIVMTLVVAFVIIGCTYRIVEWSMK